jgi:hypothetical protein
MVRPCVARAFDALGFGLALMYPASVWSDVLRAIMDISARSISLSDRPRWASWVTSFRSRREDRSPLRLASRRPRRVSRCLYHRCLVRFPWFDRGLSLVPTCASPGSRAQGRSRLAVAPSSPRSPARPGHALTGPSTAPGSGGLGCGIIRPLRCERASSGQHRPRDTGQFVG